ncbi:MAG: aconitate hydratase [Chitinispirillia bacterium]|nr:aconitate hydratase [Chitinispirillia bacterium]MCL2242297.1 aconitate hydratase [Chitinispirillia bacterium]
MGKNIVQKILDGHIVDGKPEKGSAVGIRIDQTLTQDATGTMAYLQFEALGFDRVKTELSVSYVDHNTIQEGFENADDHKYLETVAAKYGILFSKPGNGICHQVHVERFGKPGKTLLGSDSHTPTGGGIGMVAIGAGGLDVAVAMGGGPFYLTYPEVVKVELAGTLRPWVSAKDVVLALLEIMGTKGNAGSMVEYGGPGVDALSVPERATITNMGAELGVITSVFPSDEKTRLFLRAQGREEGYAELSADSDALYDRVIKIDLSALEPRAACPHSPGNVKKLSELKGIKVDQALVGSCTNASYRDIMLTAAMLKGKKVNPNVSLGVACGSRQVLEMVSRNGALAEIISSGARILETACGFCIGNSVAPRTDAVSVRTSNRNFFGRSGTSSAQVYLSSPEAAVAAALSGELCDPVEYFKNEQYPQITAPDNFIIDDSMILKPAADPSKVEIFRGPNIGAPPSNEACPDVIDGCVAIKVGDKITTDHIMPAGSRLKYRSNIQKYAEFVFEREDPEFSKRALDNKGKGIRNIIVGGESYGQGSSREHAAICPMYLGVKMVITISMERIHRANLVNFGIIPATFVNAGDYAKLGKDDMLTIGDVRRSIQTGAELTAVRKGDGLQVRLNVELTEREKGMVLAGSLINQCREG